MSTKVVETAGLKPGDVIQSERFWDGMIMDNSGVIMMGLHERGVKCANDQSRGAANFVITRVFQTTERKGGATCDCWSSPCAHTSDRVIVWVEAVRLGADKKINGETIRFARSVKTQGKEHFAPVDVFEQITLVASSDSVSMSW